VRHLFDGIMQDVQHAFRIFTQTYPIIEAVNELQETVTAYRRKERIL
jgi:hypothetical protein